MGNGKFRKGRNEEYQPFISKIGLKQGSIINPLLFNYYQTMWEKSQEVL